MATPRPIPIIVLCGQSNANNADIIRAAFDRAAAAGGMLVQLAVNGAPLSAELDHGGGDWQAGGGAGAGELLQALSAQLQAILDPASPSHIPGAFLKSVIWVHGGADIFSRSAASQYESNLAAMDHSLTTKFGLHDLVVAGMAEASLQHRGLSANVAANWQTVHDAQLHLAATSPRIHYVDPDDVAHGGGFADSQMFRWDYIHYSDHYGFAAAFGRALARVALPGNSLDAAFSSSTYAAGGGAADIFAWSGRGFGQVLGGAGSDLVALDQSRVSVLVYAAGAHDFRILTTGLQAAILDALQIECLRLSDGNDMARLGGDLRWIHTGGGNDRVEGADNAEIILLGRGRDYATGGNGADRIWGNLGDDTLFGNAGNDKLHGNAGNNVLTGGAEADQFFFDPGAGRDVVTDFDNGQDRLVFAGLQWEDLRIRYAHAQAIIVAGDRQIVLLDQPVASLSAADFIFL